MTDNVVENPLESTKTRGLVITGPSVTPGVLFDSTVSSTERNRSAMAREIVPTMPMTTMALKKTLVGCGVELIEHKHAMEMTLMDCTSWYNATE